MRSRSFLISDVGALRNSHGEALGGHARAWRDPEGDQHLGTLLKEIHELGHDVRVEFEADHHLVLGRLGRVAGRADRTHRAAAPEHARRITGARGVDGARGGEVEQRGDEVARAQDEIDALEDALAQREALVAAAQREVPSR